MLWKHAPLKEILPQLGLRFEVNDVKAAADPKDSVTLTISGDAPVMQHAAYHLRQMGISVPPLRDRAKIQLAVKVEGDDNIGKVMDAVLAQHVEPASLALPELKPRDIYSPAAIADTAMDEINAYDKRATPEMKHVRAHLKMALDDCRVEAESHAPEREARETLKTFFREMRMKMAADKESGVTRDERTTVQFPPGSRTVRFARIPPTMPVPQEAVVNAFRTLGFNDTAGVGTSPGQSYGVSVEIGSPAAAQQFDALLQMAFSPRESLQIMGEFRRQNPAVGANRAGGS